LPDIQVPDASYIARQLRPSTTKGKDRNKVELVRR
jgi:hypothetical protein